MSTAHPWQAEAMAALESAHSIDVLEEYRVSWLGKKGRITESLKTLGALPPEERKAHGALLNQLKQAIEAAIGDRQQLLQTQALQEKLANERVDITLPAREIPQGGIHPISHVITELSDCFRRMGFTIAQGPQIEDEEHNFDALNIPASHPARQMHDTFYLHPENAATAPKLLRTHTSPVQIRTMRESALPLRCIAPGRTYRCDSDQTHTPMFHQMEGLVIERGVHFGHLKGLVIEFLRSFFELPDVPVRFRPSYFPFTEPSAEVDIGCLRENGQIRIGQGSQWLEVMGCGMVHPNVLRACNINPDQWQGFAFGVGIERLAMLKYQIPDLRTFFQSDIRWLRHYGFSGVAP